MIDKDGRFTFSDSKKIIIKNPAQNLAIYPNPIKVGSKLQLEWAGFSGKVNYKLIDMQGQLIIQNDCNFLNGKSNITLFKNIPSGNYILQMFLNGKMQNTILMVQP